MEKRTFLLATPQFHLLVTQKMLKYVEFHQNISSKFLLILEAKSNI